MKKTIFLTGATGNMGQEALKQLLERNDKFQIVALVLPTRKDEKIISKYKSNTSLKIIWGDLTNYDDVLKGVEKADYVLHVGGMVSPMADYYPELTTKVNVLGAKNIVQAIQHQPNKDKIKLIYIGTVAQTGDRNPPIHWGRTGDPIKISEYDNYAVTKTIAEREVIESGLKYWVSLRQTGILYSEMGKDLDPIMYHVPVKGVFEWVTSEDSGRLLANACEDNIPEDFWRKIYNIGGGKTCRTNNYEFLLRTGKAKGFSDIRKLYDLNWFATQNFHGQWYADSDKLEEYLAFRKQSVDDFLNQIKKESKIANYLVKLIPLWVLKKYVMKPIAYKKKYGSMDWIVNNKKEKINAYFGSLEKWKQIKTWNEFVDVKPSEIPKLLDHGYDESKPKNELDIEDMKKAAEFRGGQCLSTKMQKGNLESKLIWRCAFDHKFDASPTLILLGGHWCPECFSLPKNHDEEAKKNPFFSQVWYPLHKEINH